MDGRMWTREAMSNCLMVARSKHQIKPLTSDCQIATLLQLSGRRSAEPRPHRPLINGIGIKSVFCSRVVSS